MSALPSPELSRPQKAAALVMAVGAKQASELLAYLDESEVELLAKEIAALHSVPVGALRQVVDELRLQTESRNGVIEGGLDVARDLLARWQGPGSEVAARIAHGAMDAPFAFLADVNPAEVVTLVADEHPQTIALVLAHLPATYAAKVLEGVDPALQGEVAIRVATMDRVAPEVVRRAEQVIRQRLAAVGPTGRDGVHGGKKELAGILNRTSKQTESTVLRRLTERHPELAEEVRALMFVFEDIIMLRDRDLQEVLRAVEAKDLALAVKGVPEEVKEAVMRNISDRARDSLQEEVEILGAVKLADVEAARLRIVAQVRALDEAGKIVLRREGEGGLIE